MATGAEKPGLYWHLARTPSAWQGWGCRALTNSVRSQQPISVERSLEAAGFPSPTVQTQGLSGKETEVSCRMVHSRAHWKCLHLIIKMLKDMALFQKNRNIFIVKFPLQLKFLLTFLSEASRTFSQRFAHFWQERIWPLSSIMLHSISTDCLFSHSLGFSHDVNTHCSKSSKVPLDLL